MRDSISYIPAAQPEAPLPEPIRQASQNENPANRNEELQQEPAAKPKPKATKPVVQISSVSSDTLSNGTESVDTLAPVAPHTEPEAMILVPQPEDIKAGEQRSDPNSGSSWVMIGLMAIFLFVCLKFRKSRKYMSLIIRDLTDTRLRENMFDNTVRETSFLFLLNLMTLLSYGVLLYYLLLVTGGLPEGGNMDVEIGICICVALAYGIFMWCAYWVCGTVFYKQSDARVWIRGYTAGQGLMGPLMFILALMAMFYNNAANAILWCAGGVFVLSRIILIVRGSKIFMRNMASLMLFFYYLCIIELIPIIGVYAGACALCGVAK